MSGKGAAAKLGILLGAAWGLIFTGCLINTNDVQGALIITGAICLTILAIVFTAHVWYPALKKDLGLREDED